jgi:ABC-type transport system substrate-binding protein
MALALYESLVAYKYGTTEIEPRLATEWKISDDGKTYTFKLRPNVKFTDGSPFNADAVKVSFERLAGMGFRGGVPRARRTRRPPGSVRGPLPGFRIPPPRSGGFPARGPRLPPPSGSAHGPSSASSASCR